MLLSPHLLISSFYISSSLFLSLFSPFLSFLLSTFSEIFSLSSPLSIFPFPSCLSSFYLLFPSIFSPHSLFYFPSCLLPPSLSLSLSSLSRLFFPLLSSSVHFLSPLSSFPSLSPFSLSSTLFSPLLFQSLLPATFVPLQLFLLPTCLLLSFYLLSLLLSSPLCLSFKVMTYYTSCLSSLLFLVISTLSLLSSLSCHLIPSVSPLFSCFYLFSFLSSYPLSVSPLFSCFYLFLVILSSLSLLSSPVSISSLSCHLIPSVSPLFSCFYLFSFLPSYHLCLSSLLLFLSLLFPVILSLLCLSFWKEFLLGMD